MSEIREQHDPDPWTVASLVVAAVAMFAQLAQLGVQIADHRKSAVKMKPHSRVGFENLRQQVESAAQSTQRLIRILGRAAEPSHPLQDKFRFGVGKALFYTNDFQPYSELVQKIALDAGSISAWALNLIQVDPDFAGHIGAQIIAEMKNVSERINRLYVEAPKNEEVLEESLDMFRTFIRILERLDNEN
jgi:hypothetical protein